MGTIGSRIKHSNTREAYSSRSVLPTPSCGEDVDTSAKNTEKSLDSLLELFSHLPGMENLQVIATKFDASSKDNCTAKGCMVPFKCYADVVNLANGIVASCTSEKNSPLTNDSVALRYDGLSTDGKLSYLNKTDSLVVESWNKFNTAMRDVDREENPASCKPNAIVVTSARRDFFLVAIQNPVTTIKHRSIFFGKRKFSQVGEGQLLTLSHQIDAVAFKDTIVFFTSRGTSFFVDESVVQKKAEETAEKMTKLNLVSNNRLFLEAVKVPRNAHWLLAVDDKRLEKIQDRKIQKEVAKVFHLKCSDGRFSTETKGEIASLLKILGKRGMLDVVENVPMEVSGSGSWNPEKEK